MCVRETEADGGKWRADSCREMGGKLLDEVGGIE